MHIFFIVKETYSKIKQRVHIYLFLKLKLKYRPDAFPKNWSYVVMSLMYFIWSVILKQFRQSSSSDISSPYNFEFRLFRLKKLCNQISIRIFLIQTFDEKKSDVCCVANDVY